MEVILNELSVEDLTGTPDDARQKMAELLQLCKKAKDELQCNGLRLPNAGFFGEELVPGYTLNNWLTDNNVSQTLRTLFNGLRRYPYLEDLTEEQEVQFVNSHFRLNEPAHHSHGREAIGLANAWLQNRLAVSFCSHLTWSKCQLGLTIDNVLGGPYEEKVYNACSDACITDAFKEWFRKTHLPPLQTHDDVDVWFPPENGYQLSTKAKDDLIYWYQSNQHDKIKKIESFFKEIWIDPFNGTGQVEPLSENLSGWWSRRINQEHRLVYKFEDGILVVCSCKGHYNDLNCDP